MTNPEEIDVVIIGAGPVGVTAANLLGQAGVRVLVVDKAPDILSMPRAIGLDDEGARVLQATGLMPTIEPDLLAIDSVKLMSPDRGELMSLGVDTPRNGHPILRTFHQPTLERHLRAGLSRFDHVELAVSTECVGFVDRGECVDVQLVSDDGCRAIRTRYLLGCDGAHSFVRRTLGIEMVGKTYSRAWLVVDVHRDPTPGRYLHFLCDPARPGVTLPSPTGGRRWEFMLVHGDEPESMQRPDTVRDLLAPWGDLDAMGVDRTAVYTFHARTAAALQRGNTYLLGDAAHLTPPFAGQGLMAGLRDALNLTWKIAANLRDGAPRHLVDTYEPERRPNVVKMVDLARKMGALIMPTNATAARVRDAALCGAQRLKWWRSVTRDVRLKPTCAIREGFVAPRSGETFPQISVRDARGTTALSDTYRNGHWAIVGMNAAPTDHLRTEQHRRWSQRGRLLCIRGQNPRRPRSTGSLVELQSPTPLPPTLRPGHFYVVRPDNHVYASCEGPHLEGIVDNLLTTLRAA